MTLAEIEGDVKPRLGSRCVRVKLRNIRGFVVHHMRDVRELINSETARTRAIFAKYIDRITLTPTGEHYVASGTWNLLGGGSIGGAGGPALTVRTVPLWFKWKAA